jgi:hypothetical protein
MPQVDSSFQVDEIDTVPCKVQTEAEETVEH